MPARSFDDALDVPACWSRIAHEVAAFAREQGLLSRDLIVLLPFAQHLPLARAAWVASEPTQWLPRFETTQTLARALRPPPPARAGALAFDPVTDRLQVAQLLESRVPDWRRRDPRGHELAVQQVVDTAQALARARLALPPAQRDDWLATARAALGGPAGPGAQERALARLALEWSDSADASFADALHTCRPAGWVALRGGAADPLVEALLAQGDRPALWIEVEASPAPQPNGHVQVTACADFEEEAQRSTAQVLDHLARDRRPVALVALDRALVRRVHALLERQQVVIADETGWKLSTTRAAASVAGLLRAAHARASTDDVLDWLASTERDCDGLDALDRAWRKDGLHAVSQVDATRLDPAAAALWQQWLDLAEPLRVGRRLALPEWLSRLRDSLQRASLWERLDADAAGRQVFDALRCRQDPEPGSAWAAQAAGVRFDAGEFRGWVDSVLEQVSFEAWPAGQEPSAVAVIVTPLARAALRPFGAIVCPGADEKHLGAQVPANALLGEALAAALGLPGRAQRHRAEQWAFAQLLRAPRLSLLCRHRDDAEPLQPSPLLLQMQFAAQRSGRAFDEAVDARVAQEVTLRPERRPLPRATGLLPDTLTATAYEALRTCPYRYFAQRLLKLDESEELDDALDKRDYGTWLHAVLQDFHQRRDAGDAAADLDLLIAVASEQQARLLHGAADFLPYAAAFEALAPRYLDWLHGEEARGMQVRDTELELHAAPASLHEVGLRLYGKLDRVDTVPAEGGVARRVVDYKTSSVVALKDKLRSPSEDSQLPFYAALLAHAQPVPPGGLQAIYLALDGREGVEVVSHPQIEASAEALLTGIAADFARLRAGAALPALGEGSACEHCSARGLCRRDHWPEEPDA